MIGFFSSLTCWWLVGGGIWHYLFFYKQQFLSDNINIITIAIELTKPYLHIHTHTLYICFPMIRFHWKTWNWMNRITHLKTVVMMIKENDNNNGRPSVDYSVLIYRFEIIIHIIYLDVCLVPSIYTFIDYI